MLLRHYLWATLALGLAALVLMAGLLGLLWFGRDSLGTTRLLVMGGVLVVLGLVNFLSTVFYGGHGRLVLNHFDLSTGFEPAEEVQQEPAEGWRFTMWLHQHLKEVAGLERPLTFCDLAPQEYAGLSSRATGEAHSIPFKVVESVREHRARIQDDIELKQVTTCISLGRPYVLPFDPGLPDAQNFYFCKDEWKAFLPAELLQHLLAHSPRPLTLFVDESKKKTQIYHQLPPPQDLPVVLTTRLSMSFPGLFSAMPMSFIRQRPHQQGAPLAHGWQLLEGQQVCANCQKVYFGDGGLTINFPLMLFDELVPADPTFALNLVPTSEGQELPEPRVVWREGRDDDGVYLMPPQPLRAFDQPEEDQLGGWRLPVVSFKHLLAYAMGLFESARDWGDNALIPLPGYSERIAHITLPPYLGGLNLRMTGNAINILRYKGAVAGHLLVQRFDEGNYWNWKIHRAAHFMTLTADLEALLQEYTLEFGPQGTLKMDGLGEVPMQNNTVFSGLTPNQAGRIQAFIEAGAGTFFSGYRRRKGARGMLRYRPRL